MLSNKHFKDWENLVFGYGYGSGERFIMFGLKDFLSFIPKEGNYDFEKLEEGVGSLVAWLFINLFCHNDLIEYGTSPRFSWLTEKGKILKEYFEGKTVDELLQILEEESVICMPTYCNCKIKEGKNPCGNPLF